MPTRQAQLEAFEGRVRFIQLREADEQRGKLIEIDYAALPFAPCRSFIVGDVPNGWIRGGHAHKECEQFLICLQGRLHIEVLFKRRRAEITLNNGGIGLYIGARIWARQTYFENATLLVLASLPYDVASYIDDPEQI
jgi:hypothetical protein